MTADVTMRARNQWPADPDPGCVLKVQQSLYTTEAEPQLLAYTQDRGFVWRGPAPAELLERLAGRPRVYFRAVLKPAAGVKGGVPFTLLEEVPSQPW